MIDEEFGLRVTEVVSEAGALNGARSGSRPFRAACTRSGAPGSGRSGQTAA